MTSRRSDLVDICVDQKYITAKAVLVSDGTTEAWLPLAQVEIKRNKDGTIAVTLPEWLAKDKGLI